MKKLVWLCVLAMALSCMFGAAAEESEVYWSFGVPMTQLYSDYMVLVNRDTPLDKDYEPEDLVKVTEVMRATSAQISLRQVAADALKRMFEAADAEGYTLYLKSGYRSYGTQTTTYNNYLARNNNVDDGVVAPPGTSEHQTGLSCDVLNRDYASRSRMTTDFSETLEAQWLKENAPSYGFVIRYPEEKADITKTIFEPWHLRYVGREAAGYMKVNDLCLEEFTDRWQTAVAQFQGEGGDVDAQIEQEKLEESRGPESRVLDVYGEDGDAEVSLSL
ncbi:MAG: M15 family metallopeptidase [Eubacteriales bacterium]|nr:M15 family metallopeptidase [Eubacteriales bacterium]